MDARVMQTMTHAKGDRHGRGHGRAMEFVDHLNQLKEGDAFLDALAHAYAGAARKVVAVPACAGCL